VSIIALVSLLLDRSAPGKAQEKIQLLVPAIAQCQLFQLLALSNSEFDCELPALAPLLTNFGQ